MNTEYLKEAVGKYLCKALCEVATRRPDRPIEFLAYYLIALYEKDLELQQAEKAVDSKEVEQTADDLALTAAMSQMFTQRLSASLSKQDLEAISPATASSSITIGLDMDETPTEEDSELSVGRKSSDDKVESEGGSASEEEKSLPEAKERTESPDDEAATQEPVDFSNIYSIPERKPSAMRENKPVTEKEIKEFGTSDPFLARRDTRLFDVNFASIGSSYNQPNTSEENM